VSGFPSVSLGDAAVVSAMQAIGTTSTRRAPGTSDLSLEVRGRLTELVDGGDTVQGLHSALVGEMRLVRT
jgi:hypothetical protein